MSFPSQNALGELVAAIRRPARRSSEPSNEQHLPAELAARYLEEKSVAELVCREKPNTRARRFRYDFGVWFDAGRGIGLLDAVGADLRRRALRRGLWPASWNDEAALRAQEQGAGGNRVENWCQ